MSDTIRDTQRASYDAIASKMSERQAQVLAEIRESGTIGQTLFELSENLGWPVNCVSGRVTELAKRGKIQDHGIRRVNPASGKNGIAWVSA